MTKANLFIKLVLLIMPIFLLISCSKTPRVVNDGYGDYLLIPAGTFQMGDNFDEGNSDEIPLHEVYLDAYYIGKYKVTNEEYKKFIEDGGYTNSVHWTAGGFGEYGEEPEHCENWESRGGGLPDNETFPVVGVSWFEAMAYCSWLSAKTGCEYRLPTEAEWEKAARGTDQRRYAWGDNIDPSYTNYDNGEDRSQKQISPVGFYNGETRNGFSTNDNSSPYGVYDMTGNVTEWCSDWYDREYYINSPKENSQGPETGSSRVLRAGGYVDAAYYQRAASRHKMGAHFKSYKTGFRCVRGL